mgnify:CR=1 FL=1
MLRNNNPDSICIILFHDVDRVIGPSENNRDVYNAVAKDIVCGAIQGRHRGFSS